MVHVEQVSFPSGGSDIAGTLYRPEDPAHPPVVVMAHGFAARRNWGLPEFAERFAEEGIAALTFDYRGFGDSGGDPRRVIAARRQRDDYRAAIDYVRSRSDVDDDAVALWGMSYSGGHVLNLAATEDVRTVVATVPFTDGAHVAGHVVHHGGWAYVRGMVGSVYRDAKRILLRRDPNYVQVVDQDADFAILATPGAREGFESMIPEDEREDWPNRTAARVLVEIPFNRPVSSAPDIDVPVFVLEATDDEIVPARAIDRLVDRLEDVRRVRVPANHFEALVGPLAGEVAAKQARFLREQLR